MSPQTKQIHSRIARVAFPSLALALIGLFAYAQMNDGDNDGIPDGFESLFGLNMNADDSAGDPDQDGLSNLAESLLGTDPFNADTDRDGWNDAADANPISRAVFPWGEPRFTFDDQILYTWPPWAISAQADGGQWIDEAPWGWMPEDGGSRLLMRLDRTQLSNDLWLAVAAPGAVAGDYLVSLCDTNFAALAPPIALAPSTTPWLTNRLPLAAYPAAAVVALFSTQGVAHVTLSMLYADANGDGLDDLQAAQLAAAAATNTPATVTVSGVVSYSGTQPGFVHVVAVTNASSWTSPWNTTLVNPGAFALGAIPVSATYWIRAYVDANENNSNDCWEARGVGLPAPLYLVCATNVTVTLTDPDSNNDGLSDWGAMQVGLDPALSNACARFPFVELFETHTVHLGDIHGQHGWVASVTNTAWVQSNRVYAGQQALMLDAPASTATVHQVFAGDAAPIVWTDLRMIAQLGCPDATNTTDAACGFFFDESGRLVVLDGLQPAGRKWVTLTNHPPVSAGEWVRISICLNFAEQRWLICLNGSKVAENLGFGIPCDQLHILSMKGERGVVDNLSVSTNQPANLSLDNDALLDTWELQYFGNLAQAESGDPDADGLTNLQEYQLGTDPTNPDTDADTLPDGWEVARALNPLAAADAALDADTDGLSNLQEYQLGTNPMSADTDADGMPDTWEVDHALNPLVNDAALDADVDGLSNLQEYQLGTNPANPDTDADTLPDGWEVARALNPLAAADAALDADNDGLSNLAEYQIGTNPMSTDTDGDTLSDGYEVNTLQTDPILADTDGDDYSDAVELARGTDPSDPASFPASEWQNHLKLILRTGTTVSNLTDVPVLVRLTPERIDYSRCASDGRDLYFTDASGLPLAFELEQWNPGGESICWVRLPSISPTHSALHFWLHVGNPAAANAATPAAVWDANYAGVWHLTETNNLLADSTLGASAAANVGAVCASGILGNARNFRGSDYLTVPPAALAAISNAVTVSLWTYGADSLPANTVCFYGSSAVGRELNAHIPWSDGNVYWDAFGNCDRISKAATAPLYKGTWNHWAFTKNAATGVMAVYCNGELWHSGTGKTRAANPITAFRIGMSTDGWCGYQGRMDELRVETVARSADWNRFQYRSMRDQVLIYGDQVVSIVHAAPGSEAGPTPALFTVSRLGLNTNLPLSVVLAAPAGSATEGVDYTALPRVVTIPAGLRSTTLAVPVINDYWVETTETVTVSVATADYRVSTSNVTASASIADNDTLGDSSGMSDAFQLAFFGQLGISPSADPDADNLSNLGEYLNGTDPNNPDTDADGIPDGWEVARVLNPLSAADAPLDFDNDGLSNLREYQLGTNPRSADTDADGMPDTWEVDHALNPIVNDAALDPDADGLSNLKEFQNSTDPHNPDTDGDGLLDGYEVNTSHTSPLKVDTDADGMPDKWEVDHALNPLVNDAALDPDNDQLLNLDEFLQGTHPQMADTDGDGVSDQVEIMAQANPLTKDFTGGVTTVLTLHGSDASGWAGIWTCQGSAIYARTRSGCLDYDLVVSNAGTFAVAVNLTQQNNLTTQSAFDLSLFIDGIFSGRQVVKAPYGTSATATYFLPELAAGTHALRIQWHNQEPNTFLQINSIALQSYGGLDVNTNGILDWLDHRRTELFDAITPATNSLVSPIFLEGTSFYQDLLAIAASFAPAGQTQQLVAVEHGVANDWYANVHLSPSNDTALVIADWATGVMITNTVAWEPLNLIDHSFSNGLAIRAGSSLRLAAWPVDATNGTVTLTLWDAATNSVTNLIATVGSPVPYAFDQAGLFTVSGVYSNANGTTNGITNGTTNGTLAVRVVSGVFNGREAACVTGQPRTWECPGLTTDAVIVADSPLDVTATILANGGMRFSLMNPTDKPLYMVARLGEDGPILDSAKISAVYGDHGSYYRVVETFSDGSRMVEVRLQLGSVPADLRVQLHVFVGGVTFLDGTLDKTLTAADFDAVGVCSYRLLQSAASFTSVCHTTQMYQDAVYIGGTR